MFNKIFGTQKTVKKYFIVSFAIAIISITILTVFEFFAFISPDMKSKVVEIHVQTEEEAEEILWIVRRCLIFAIINTALVSIILMRINMKRIIEPLTQINEATKRIADGDYDVELESKREDEIGELTKNFNKMTKGLQSTESLQKDFINNVSHELKTPISSIEGFAEILKDKDLSDEEREEYANIVIEESERLLNLSTKILKLSKLHNQEKIINKQEISVDEQIRKAVNLLERKWKSKNLKINLSLEPEILIGDEDMLFQVWVNILDNAIKFSNENGEIDIKLYKEKNKIVAEIKDYGIGMPKPELEKIFERFYQVDKSHSGEGSGLGLAIVKRIIELFSGEIKVESEENKGTKFIIKLPSGIEKNNKIIIS